MPFTKGGRDKLCAVLAIFKNCRDTSASTLPSEVYTFLHDDAFRNVTTHSSVDIHKTRITMRPTARGTRYNLTRRFSFVQSRQVVVLRPVLFMTTTPFALV